MSKKLVRQSDILKFSLLCCLIYGASYITRINFTAMISEIIKAEGIMKSEASFVTTALFVSYGAGQLIFGAIGDRVDPKKFIGAGMLISSVLNFLMPAAQNINQMAAIWFVNGFAQAIMWPSLAKITADYLSLEEYKKLGVNISVASSSATVGIYVLVPLMLIFMPYKMIFPVCGALGAGAAALWVFCIGKIDSRREEIKEKMAEGGRKGARESFAFGKGLLFAMALIGVAVCIQGILKDGITTWTPSYIQEIYNFPPSYSILITVALPLFNIVAVKFGGYVHAKFIKNEITCAAAFFALAGAASALMSAMYNVSSLLCVILAGVITGAMHSINTMIITMLPGRFEKQGRVATVSGCMNFVSYIGSSLSTYLIAKLAEGMGWRGTVLLWAALAAAGVLICAVAAKAFKKED